MNKFSIIIPLYNKEKELKETIESVLTQTHSNFELIIVDDGSTDASAEIVSMIKDKRIKLFAKKNEGVSIARNFGVEKSNSEYIAFLDADDIWYSNHLENINTSILKFPEANWFASAYEKKRTNKLTSPMDSPVVSKGENWSGLVEDFFENCFIDSLVNSSNVCFKKDFFGSLNGFNKTLTHGEDTDLWIRSALKSPIFFSNKITVIQKLNSSNRSTTIKIKNRKNINLNTFLEHENNNTSLKKYLDLNRYSQLIKFKLLDGDKRIIKAFKKEINPNNLNKKQRFLMKQSSFTLHSFMNIQKVLEKLGIRFSSF